MEPKRKYVLVNKVNKDSIFKELMSSPRITLDVETTSLDYLDPKEELVCIGISNAPYKGFTWRINEKNMRLIQEILYQTKVLANHNIKFDLHWIHRYGLKYPGKLFDTLVAKHLLDENCRDKSLKGLARRELGMFELTEDEKIMIQHRKAKTLPSWEEWRKYNGGDVDAAYRLWIKYEEELKEQGLMELMETEMKVLKTLRRMEERGFKIDMKVHKELSKLYEGKIADANVQVKRLLGDINLNSPKQLQTKLFDELGLPSLVETNTGGRSCSEAALLAMMASSKVKASQKVVLQSLLDFRGCSKLYNVYLLGLIKNNQIKEDGKVHCNYKLAGTVTGRLSCSEPNLQNIPRKGDIKQMFTSSFPGGSIIQVDYSQAELRILAHFSKDKLLMKAFREGRDIHQEVAAKVFNKPYDKVTEEERKFAKKVNFGVVYCISAPGLADKLVEVGRLNKSTTRDKIKFAEKLLKDWFEAFPGVNGWMKEQRLKVIREKQVVGINGRIRRLPQVDDGWRYESEAIRQGTNSPIQGGAGDITKWSMYRLDTRIMKEKMKSLVIGNVHDAVMVDSPREEVNKVVSLIKEIFKQPPIPLIVPLEFDIKVGPNWNELKGIEDAKDQ